jgi:hypothetical protein
MRRFLAPWFFFGMIGLLGGIFYRYLADDPVAGTMANYVRSAVHGMGLALSGWAPPVVNGKKRCRMHGGAKGSGAPCSEAERELSTRRFTAEAIRERRMLREWIKAARTAAAKVE